MGTPNTTTITLSSIGNSAAANLDRMNGAPIGVSVTGSSSGTFAYTVQYTLDDITAPSVSWINDPNATALTSNSSSILTLPPGGDTTNPP